MRPLLACERNLPLGRREALTSFSAVSYTGTRSLLEPAADMQGVRAVFSNLKLSIRLHIVSAAGVKPKFLTKVWRTSARSMTLNTGNMFQKQEVIELNRVPMTGSFKPRPVMHSSQTHGQANAHIITQLVELRRLPVR